VNFLLNYTLFLLFTALYCEGPQSVLDVWVSDLPLQANTRRNLGEASPKGILNSKESISFFQSWFKWFLSSDFYFWGSRNAKLLVEWRQWTGGRAEFERIQNLVKNYLSAFDCLSISVLTPLLKFVKLLNNVTVSGDLYANVVGE